MIALKDRFVKYIGAKEMSLYMLGADKKLNKDNKLIKLNLLTDWSRVKKHLKQVHKNDINPKGGPKAYDNPKI